MLNPEVLEATTHGALHPRGKFVAAVMVAGVNKRFHKDTITSVERMAMMMDPRIKSPPAICGFNNGELEVTKKKVSKLMYMYKLQEGHDAEAPAVVDVDAPPLVVDPLVAATAALDNAGSNGNGNGNNAPSGNSEIHPDLAAYLSEPSIPLGSPNFDPLKHHGRLNRRADI